MRLQSTDFSPEYLIFARNSITGRIFKKKEKRTDKEQETTEANTL